MATIKVTFTQLLQDSQDLGGDDEHMVSRAFCVIDEPGEARQETHVDIKQPAGGSFDRDPLEVSRAQGYEGRLGHQQLREAAEKYYRDLVGPTGTGIQVRGGSVRMRDNRFIKSTVFEFEVPD